MARRALREALRLATDDPVAAANLHLELAKCYQRIGALSMALRETTLGIELSQKLDLPDAKRATARLRARRSGVYSDQFRPRKALEVGLRAVEEAEASGELDALARAYTSIDAYADGRWDDAIAMYSKAQEVARRSGNVPGEGAATANLGEVLISRGRFEEAEVLLQESRRVLRGQNVLGFALFAETQLGRLLMERGDHDGAVDALRRVIGEANRIGQDFFAVDASVHLADALTRAGEPLEALAIIDRAAELAGEDAALYEVPLRRLRAGALVELEQPDEALSQIDPALASARGQRLVYEEALLLAVKAQIGDAEALEEARRLLENLGSSMPPLAVGDVVDDVSDDEVAENGDVALGLDETRGVVAG
jgi:tetratricopeptide (TPR) repeat protein